MKRILLLFLTTLALNVPAGEKAWMVLVYHGERTETFRLAGEPTFTGGVGKAITFGTRQTIYFSGTYVVLQTEPKTMITKPRTKTTQGSLSKEKERQWLRGQGLDPDKYDVTYTEPPMTPEQKRRWLVNNGYDPERYDVQEVDEEEKTPTDRPMTDEEKRRWLQSFGHEPNRRDEATPVK